MEELSELLDSRKIPHIFHVMYSEKEDGYGVGTINHPNERKCVAVAKMSACGNILNRESNPFEVMTLVAMAKAGE